ncbi:hypothetical protein [[Eubacterium] cellulosolvens]
MRVVSRALFCVLILLLFSCLTIYLPPAGAVDEYKFSTNIKINDDTGIVQQTVPDIAVADNGYVYIVWSDGRNDNTNLDIYCSKSTDSGNMFGDGVDNTDIRVDDDQTGARQRDPVVATYNNEVYVVWMDDRLNHDHIYFAKSTDNGATFGPNIRVDNAPSDKVCEYPDIALTSTGTICVVWHDFRDGDANIYYSESTNGGSSFSTDVRVDDTGTGTSDQKYPKIAIGDGGDRYIVWQDDRNGNYDIFFAHSPSGTPNFGTNKRVDDTSDTSLQTRPTIGVYGTSDVYIAWRDARDAVGGDIYFSKSTDKGGTFSNNKRVDKASTTSPTQDFPELTVNTEGKIYIVWLDKRTSRGSSGSSRAINFRVYFINSTDGGSTFNTEFRVDDTGSATENVDKNTPVIAMRGKNRIFIAWQDRRNGNDDIYFSRWGKASEMVGYAPTLTNGWVKETELGEQIGGVQDDFRYSVTYTDFENDPPASGYPKLYIYTDQTKSKQISGSPFAMKWQLDNDNIYDNGEIYYYITKLPEDGYYAYQFETKAATGNLTMVTTLLLLGPKVDDTLPTFSEPTPAPTVWFNSKSVECSILISDGDGSGVERNLIAYRSKNNGSAVYDKWRTNPTKTAVTGGYRCTATVTFGEGAENYIQWNATDQVGKKYGLYNLSELYEVRVDTTPVKFTNPQPPDIYYKNTKQVTCSITINDFGGSGVDGSSVQYSYLKAGEFLWTGPLPATKTSNGESINVSTKEKVPFENGEENYIKWHARDLAGNEVVSPEFQVKIDINRPSNNPPQAPTWLTPTETRDETPRFEWSQGYDADNDPLEYFIRIGTTESGGDVLPWTSTGEDPYYIVTSKMNPGTYYVQVKVFDGLDNSTVFQQMIEITASGDTPPLPPVAIYPDLTSSAKPLLNWTPPPESVGKQYFYLVQIGTSSGRNDILKWYPVGAKNEYNVLEPLEDGIYYIQVMSQNDAGTSYSYEETLKVAHFNIELTVMDQVKTKQGGSPTAKITLKNNCSVSDSVTINITGELTTKSSVTISTTPASPIALLPGESRDVTLTIKLPPQIQIKKYLLDIQAISEDGETTSISHTLVLDVSAADSNGGTNGGGNGGTDDSDAGGILDYLWLIILIIIIIVVIGIIAGLVSSRKRAAKEREEFFGKQDKDEYEKLYGPRGNGSGRAGPPPRGSDDFERKRQ